MLKVDRKDPEILIAIGIAPIFGKKGTVNARPAIAGEFIETILDGGRTETRNTAGKGDWIVTNPSGEQYIIKDETFKKRYEGTSVPGVYKAKGYCRAITNPFGKTIQIMASWGEEQIGGADCMIADTCDEQGGNMGGEPYIIDKEAFKKTYVIK